MKRLLSVLFLPFLISVSNAQSFVNGDLYGFPVFLGAPLPAGWTEVSYLDPICIATFGGQATPDLTDQFAGFIYCGIPYSGPTFVSGLLGGSAASPYHEGIQQAVSGFCVGCTYSVNFFQAVVKQNNFNDSSGCWSVYIDNTLAGTSPPTFNTNAPGSGVFPWELRSINFVATSTTHIIKFLPTDDDPITTMPHGIRMGIDSIFLLSVTPLPINLLSFSAGAVSDKVHLRWTTSSEINNDFFTIEKSKNNKEWNEVIKIEGAGNSTTIKNYQVNDDFPYPGISYYRLKQTDYDGKFTYSKVELVSLKGIQDIQVYPNPVKDFLTIHVSEVSNTIFTLFNFSGGKISQFTVNEGVFIFDATLLRKGSYLLTIEQNGVLIRKEKIVKE